MVIEWFFVACEYFRCMFRDECYLIAAVDGAIIILVDEMDLRGDWEVFECHVIKDD